ncbi:MAG: glycosyltransferase family 4 protein [Candidatus Micrarchaeota archaeon]
MSDTLMVLSGAHPVHRAFGEAIGADFFQIKNLATKNQPAPLKAMNLVKAALSIPTSYKYILCESCYFYPALKRRLGLLGKSKIININCGPILQHILNGRVKGIEAKMLVSLLKEVNGHLVLGEFGKEVLHKFHVKAPIKVVYPFISSERFKSLKKQKPKLNSHTISIIATTDAYNKGIDLLFDAIAEVSKIYHDVSLDVITRMDESEIKKFNKNIPMRVFKEVEDLGVVLSQSALYIQPSRSDVFSVSVLEAMACGVPVIVSDQTGAKEIVAKLAPKMVVGCNKRELSKSIIDYFNMRSKDRVVLSKKSRKISKEFEEEKMIKLFTKEYKSLINRI